MHSFKLELNGNKISKNKNPVTKPFQRQLNQLNISSLYEDVKRVEKIFVILYTICHSDLISF